MGLGLLERIIVSAGIAAVVGVLASELITARMEVLTTIIGSM